MGNEETEIPQIENVRVVYIDSKVVAISGEFPLMTSLIERLYLVCDYFKISITNI